jgi:hypothetical protein
VTRFNADPPAEFDADQTRVFRAVLDAYNAHPEVKPKRGGLGTVSLGGEYRADGGMACCGIGVFLIGARTRSDGGMSAGELSAAESEWDVGTTFVTGFTRGFDGDNNLTFQSEARGHAVGAAVARVVFGEEVQP